MAGIDATLLPSLALSQAGAQTDYQNEPYGLLRLAEQSTSSCPLITEEVRNFLKSNESRTFSWPTLAETDFATTTSESLTFPTNFSTTGTMTATKYTITSGFKHTPRVYQDNQVREIQDFGHKQRLVAKAIAGAKATLVSTLLNTNRSQIWNGADGTTVQHNTFNATTDALEVTLAGQAANYYGNLNDLWANNYATSAPLAVFNKLGLNRVENAIVPFGPNNSENRQNSFNRPFPVMTSISMGTQASGTTGFGFLVEPGAIGEIQNVTYDYANESQSTDGYRWGVTDGSMPFLNAPCGFIYRSVGQDAAGLTTTGHTATERGAIGATVVHQYLFVHEFYLMTQYQQDLATRPGHILKVNNLST